MTQTHASPTAAVLGRIGLSQPVSELARRRWDDRRFPYTWDDDGEAAWILFRAPDYDVLG